MPNSHPARPNWWRFHARPGTPLRRGPPSPRDPVCCAWPSETFPAIAFSIRPRPCLLSTLLGSLELDLEILRFNLLGGLLSGVLGTIEGLIAPIAPVLDQTLVALFDVLGLGIGEADLRLHGIDCRNAALVQ